MYYFFSEFDLGLHFKLRLYFISILRFNEIALYLKGHRSNDFVVMGIIRSNFYMQKMLY